MNAPFQITLRFACSALVPVTLIGLLGLNAPLQEDQAPPESESSAGVVAAADLEQEVQTAVALLLANQEDYAPDQPVGRLAADAFDEWQRGEGERLGRERAKVAGAGHEWPYEGVYRVQGGVIPSGYRVGGTAIVCQSLIAVAGYSDDEARRAAVERSVEFLLEFLNGDAAMQVGPKRGYDVRGWGHAYALSLFLRLSKAELLDGEAMAMTRDIIPDLIDCLVGNEIKGGGWNYAQDTTHSPFQTGATLLALFEARAQGFDVPGEVVERALDALASGRHQETGAFAYSGRGTEAMHASSARAAVAELCLYRAGRSDIDDLRRAVEGFFNGWPELLKRKSQQGTHEGPYSIAPYYFFFGHTYAALAAEYLPEEERPKWRARMREVLWRTREGHGGWNDRIFPRTESFSTAMALQALLAPRLASVPEWPGE